MNLKIGRRVASSLSEAAKQRLKRADDDDDVIET